MKYTVEFIGRCSKTITVEADSPEEAEDKAWDIVDTTAWPEEEIADVECVGCDEILEEEKCHGCRGCYRGTSVNDMIG